MDNSPKILIVDDEPLHLKPLHEELIQNDYQVLQATDGKEGLEIALREHPDIILLDIIMPVMDGITMLKKLREDAWGKTAKVILLTNLSDPTKMQICMDEGSCDFLIKADWKIDDVLRKTQEQLNA